MHDASDRDPPPRCAPGTRKKVIQDILTWIKDPKPTESILWLNGPFGNGKSAIMQTIAETLRSHSQLHSHLAGSFFFGRGKRGRDKAEYLVPTIALQIANNIPGTRKFIDTALIRDPLILSKSIDAQFRYLITEPLQLCHSHSVQSSIPSHSSAATNLRFLITKKLFKRTRTPSHGQSSSLFHTPTVLIDGLDECEDHEFQRLILIAISTAAFEDHTPLRFLVASRPERQINEIFLSQPFDKHHYPITLVNDYETREELREHLRSHFDDIYKRKSDLTFAADTPWPSKQELDELAYRASGQFLYASTVLKFVDSNYHSPMDQLKLVLERQPGNAAAFSSMDALYTQILRSCPHQENLLTLFRSIVTLSRFSHFRWRYLDSLSIVSGLRVNPEILIIIGLLSSVIDAEKYDRHDGSLPWQGLIHCRYPTSAISVHHHSLIEFLTDKERSGSLFIDTDIGHNEIIARLDTLVANCLSACEPSHIHPSTWSIVADALEHDLFAHGIQSPFGWIRLQRTLNQFMETWNHWGSLPSKISPEFLAALSCVLYVLRKVAARSQWYNSVDLSLQIADIEKYIDVCTRVLDATYITLFVESPPTFKMWQIAGAVSLPHWEQSEDYNTLGITCPSDLTKLSKLTGLSIEEIILILTKSWYCFDVNFSADYAECQIKMKKELQSFLRDQSRSGKLHLAYRSIVIEQFISKFMVLTGPVSHLSLIISEVFDSFVSYGWNIRPDIDSVDDTVFIPGIVELLSTFLNNHSISVRSFFGVHRVAWLCRQLQVRPHFTLLIERWSCAVLPQVVRAIPEYGNVATMLRDIIKDEAIRYAFRSRSSWWPDVYYFKLPPLGVKVFQAIGSHSTPEEFPAKFYQIQTLYGDISFLWEPEGIADGISIECHTAIVEYYIFVLLTSMAGRGLSDAACKLLHATINDVQWEYHLMHAPRSYEIGIGLLTIHYLFTKRNDLIGCSVTEAMGRLPVSFLKASLRWFRRHFFSSEDEVGRGGDDEVGESENDYDTDESSGEQDHLDYQGEGFELWLEHVIAAKERKTSIAALEPTAATSDIT